MRDHQLYIDPGNSTGLVIAQGRCLVHATHLVKDSVLPFVSKWKDKLDLVVGEHPQVYPNGHVDPNHLMGLTFELGLVVGALDVPYKLYYPRQWKGNIDKDLCWTRAQKRLTQEELSCITYTGAKHDDVHDAIALFLVHVGRMRLAV